MTQISEQDIGKRVTIRLRDGIGYRDIVGYLQSTTSLLNRHGQLIEFDPQEIHIWKAIEEVPRTATSGAPLSIRIYELEAKLAKTWRAKEEELIDGWLFRADVGISKRANSALALNNKKPINEVISWYQKRNLFPAITLFPAIDSELDTELANRGFEFLHDCNVMVKEKGDAKIDFEYKCDDFPDRDWLKVTGDEKLLDLFIRSDAKYLSIKIDGMQTAAGRIAFSDDWAVLSRIWVTPEMRGKGFGGKILAALENESKNMKIALQVESRNETAIKLYESSGYTTHHVYRARELRQQKDLTQDRCC